METGVWKKATASSTGGACVEVMNTGTEYLVRDSKNPNAQFLAFTLAEWDAFLAGVKDGEFDL